MRLSTVFAAAIILSILTVGCALRPHPRLEAYLGPASQAQTVGAQEALSVPPGGVEAGLLVINDTLAPDSAPALSEETLGALSNRAQAELQTSLPLRLTRVGRPDGIAPQGDAQPLVRLAHDRGFNYLVLAIFSGYEIESPAQLPILGSAQSGAGGGGRVTILGSVTDSYARVELAFLSVKTGMALVRADGRAWSTLERPVTPLASNAYPVVRRGQLVAPIYPTEANAKDVMRGVSTSDAIDQAIMHLGEAWKKRFEG